MEKDNRSKLWDGDSDSIPLRQPKSNVSQEVSQQQDDLNDKLSQLTCSEQPKKRTELSADAKEWYPKDFPVKTSASSMQERLLRPRNIPQEPLSNPSANMMAAMSADQDIQRLQNIINTLTFDPGQFDSLLDLFMETFVPHFQNVEVINMVAKILFTQAINVQNFRYTSARLCYTVEQDCPIFRSTLHTICQEKLNAGENLQGLTYFVAELYSQLHYENLYGTLLLEAFGKLLRKPSDADIKCVCQALKLTGASLGHYNEAALNQIVEKVQNLRGSLAPSIANCVNAVVKLYNEGWGQNQTDTVENKSGTQWQPEREIQRVAADGTVYYNPDDGAELSVDEGVFLAENFNGAYLDGNYSDDADELCDPEPEMDEEIQIAFKEFLKYSKQSK